MVTQQGEKEKKKNKQDARRGRRGVRTNKYPSRDGGTIKIILLNYAILFFFFYRNAGGPGAKNRKTHYIAILGEGGEGEERNIKKRDILRPYRNNNAEVLKII